MLEHLEIRNFALIENLSIDFSSGFNVITGETGSGKSIILGALELLMGEKADVSSIRTGAQEMTVNAVISIPADHEVLSWMAEREMDTEEGLLYIRRTVRSAGGRSLIYIQNQLSSRSDLQFIADSLIDMHGQSEHQSLLQADKQRKILDSYAKNEEILAQVVKKWSSLRTLEKEKEELTKKLEEGRRQEDYLSFALNEIKNAEVHENEDEELQEKIKILSQYETIYENLMNSSERLRDAKASLYDATAFCNKASSCDSNLGEIYSRLESSRIETEDISQAIGDYLSSIDYSEHTINQLQERLSAIQKLKRKYGPTLSNVIKFAQDTEETLEISKGSEQTLSACEKEIKKCREEYWTLAKALSNKRKETANVLQKEIEACLRTLGMPNADFGIKVEDLKNEGLNGINSVDFLISANPGEPLKELKEIASGGELSRVMLALKTVLAKSDFTQTQVFDEVDSGIGGTVALSVAKCLERLADCRQVIAITHLASIASCASCQFVVSKSVENGRTYTHLRRAEGEDRVQEIARMLSGDDSDVTLQHARNLLGLN